MPRLDPWGALFAFVAAAALTVATGGAAGFFTFAAFKVGATAAGLTLLAGLFAPNPERPEAQRGGFLQSAVSAARYVYGKRNPPLQIVAIMDRVREDGSSTRCMVALASEGQIKGLTPGQWIKIDGEKVYLPTATTTQPDRVAGPVVVTTQDGGTRYRLDNVDIIEYTAADGSQGHDIREFSARRSVIDNAASSFNRPGDLPGGDMPDGNDPHSTVSSSTAKAPGAKPSTPGMIAELKTGHETDIATVAYMQIDWWTEDPDIGGVQYSITAGGNRSWVDGPDAENDQVGVIVAFRGTTPGLSLTRTGRYRVSIRTWRPNAAGTGRVYSDPEDMDTEPALPAPPGTRSTESITWTNRHKLTSLSYYAFFFRQPADENVWRRTPTVELPMEGRLITWPGQAIATYTRNAVAIVYDILRQMNYSEDEIDESTFTTEHAHAEEALPALTNAERANLAERGYADYARGGAHIRYGADLVVAADDSMENVFSQLKTVMGEGWIWAWKNKWRIETGREKEVRQFQGGPARITAHDVVDFNYEPAHRLSERFNGVRFVLEQSSAHEWEQGSIEYIDSTARADRDFGLELSRNVGTLTALSEPVAAQRIASTILERGRRNAIVNVTVRPTDDLRWMDLEPNDVVEFEEEVVASYTENLRFKGRVLSVTVQPDWSVSLTLLEEDPAIWSDSLLLPPWTQRDVASPLDIPLPVENLMVDELAYRFDGVVYIFLHAMWDAAADEGSIPVRLRARLVEWPDGTTIDDPEWYEGDWGRAEVHPIFGGPGIVPDAVYEVQAQRGFPDGLVQTPRWTPETPVRHTVGGDLDPPAEPTGFTLTAVRGGYIGEWDQPSRTDGAVRWEWLDSDDPALVGNADSNPPAGSRRGSTSATRFFEATSDTDEVRVWLRAYDQARNASDWVTATVTPLEGIAGADGEDGMGNEYVFAATAEGAAAPAAPSDGRPFDPATDQNDGWHDGTAGTGFSASSPVLYRARRMVPGTPAVGTSPYESGTTTLKAGWGSWVVEQVSHWGQDGSDGLPGLPGADGTDGMGVEYIFRATNSSTKPAGDPSNGRVFDPASPTDGYTDGLTVTSTNRFGHRWRRSVPGTPAVGTSPYSSGTTLKSGWSNWSYDGVVAVWGRNGAPGVNGEDGMGVEYIFRPTSGDAEPTLPAAARGWPFDQPVTPYTDGLTVTAAAPHGHRWSRMVPGTPAVGTSPLTDEADATSALKDGWGEWSYNGIVAHWGRDGQAGGRGLLGFSSIITRATKVGSSGAADDDDEWFLSGGVADWTGNRTLYLGDCDADERARLERVEVGAFLTVYSDGDNWGDYSLRTAITFDGGNQATIMLSHEESVGVPPGAGADIALHFTPAGTVGVAGSVWHQGQTEPDDADGNDGDYYLRTGTAEIYRKVGGMWVRQVDLSGVDATTWHSGTGVPNNSLGANGDYYFRTGQDRAEIYRKTGGMWSEILDLDAIDDGTLWLFGATHPDGNTTDEVVNAPVGSYYLLGISGEDDELDFRGDTFPDGAVFERKAADSVSFTNGTTGDWEFLIDLTGPQGVPGVRGIAGYAYAITRSTRASNAIGANTDSEWFLSGATDNWTGNRTLTIGRVGAEHRGFLQRIGAGGLVTVYIDEDNWADYTVRSGVSFDSNLDATIQLAYDESVGSPPTAGQMSFHYTPSGPDGRPGLDGLSGYTHSGGFEERVATAGGANTRARWHISGVNNDDDWPVTTTITLGRLSTGEQDLIRRIQNGSLFTVIANFAPMPVEAQIDRANWADYVVTGKTITNAGNGQITGTLLESRGNVPAIGDSMTFHASPAGAAGEDASGPDVPTAISGGTDGDDHPTASWTNPAELPDEWLLEWVFDPGTDDEATVRAVGVAASATSHTDTLVSVTDWTVGILRIHPVETELASDNTVASRRTFPPAEVALTAGTVTPPPTRTAPGAPGLTLSARGQTTATVSITAPAWGTGSTASRQYRGSSRVSGTNWPASTILDDGDTTQSFTGLTADTTYNVRLRAETNHGNSGYTSLTFTTLAATATRLATPTLTVQARDGVVGLAYSGVANATRYDIRRRVGNGAWSTIRSNDADGLHTDTNVTNGVTYTYSIRAKRTSTSTAAADTSPWSTGVDATPTGTVDPPPPPTGLTLRMTRLGTRRYRPGYMTIPAGVNHITWYHLDPNAGNRRVLLVTDASPSASPNSLTLIQITFDADETGTNTVEVDGRASARGAVTHTGSLTFEVS